MCIKPPQTHTHRGDLGSKHITSKREESPLGPLQLLTFRCRAQRQSQLLDCVLAREGVEVPEDGSDRVRSRGHTWSDGCSNTFRGSRALCDVSHSLVATGILAPPAKYAKGLPTGCLQLNPMILRSCRYRTDKGRQALKRESPSLFTCLHPSPTASGPPPRQHAAETNTSAP